MIFATGVVVERGQEKGYFLINSETMERRFIQKDLAVKAFCSKYHVENNNLNYKLNMNPIHNMVYVVEGDDPSTGKLTAPWQGKAGLPRYDRSGRIIGTEIDKGVYLTMNIITENCEPPIGIGHWEVQVFKDEFIQGLTGYEAMKSGFDCIKSIMADEMPIDSEVAALMGVIEMGNETGFVQQGIRLRLDMTPRGLLTVKVVEVTDQFNGNLRIDIKCKALLHIDTSEFPDLEFKSLEIGSRVGQICKGAFRGCKIGRLSIQKNVRYTLEVAIGSNAEEIDLSNATGLLETGSLAIETEFGDRTQKLMLPENSEVIVYPVRDNSSLKELFVGDARLTLNKKLEKFTALDRVYLSGDNTTSDAVDLQQNLDRLHMREVKVARLPKGFYRLSLDSNQINEVVL